MNKILERLLMLSKIFKRKVSFKNENGSVSINTNEFGNINKLETQQVLSGHRGKYKTKWYYRLEPECGVSADGKSPVFAVETLEHDNPIDEEMYNRFSKNGQKRFALQAGVDIKFVVPLTEEEYKSEMGE